MDISLDYHGNGMYALSTFKLADAHQGPSTPKQRKSGLRQWLRRRAASSSPSSPDKPMSSSRRRSRLADFGAPEAGSTASQSSVLRTNGTDAVVTTQDATSHTGDEDTHEHKNPPGDDPASNPTQLSDLAPPRVPEITAADEIAADISNGVARVSVRGRVLHALNGRRRSYGSQEEDDTFSTQQSMASSSQISGQRASLTAQLARGETHDDALHHQGLLDGSHHSGALLLGRTSSRSISSQQINAAVYVGLWRKDLDKSETGSAMEDVLDMPRLQRMVRQRTMLLEIKDTNDALHFVWHVRLNGGKEILKTECYPREGGPVEAPRRDGRQGSQQATAGMSKGYLFVKGIQEDPYAAMFQDRYVLSTHGNRLRIEHKMQLLSGSGSPLRHTSLWHRVKEHNAAGAAAADAGRAVNAS